MQLLETDIAIIGGGGAGLRAAIAAAEADPACRITLLSKVYPMRSHTVAAEGGAAAVTLAQDSMQGHFEDTVTGGDWLAEQDVVEYFVQHAYEELVNLEHLGCPWSRREDGSIQVRRFGGMKTERTWFAADKTGFHILHTLFQTSFKYSNIQRLDEFFVLDLLVHEQQIVGVLAIQLTTGELYQIHAKSVILATGGAGRVFHHNTNGGIVTGDGMALAYRHGVALRDMEFVQYHPTGLPGSGILITEACRGEGGILLNRDGYRYLQDYGLGPQTPLGKPENKCMELGPRDKLSQAFWHEQQQGRTGDCQGHAVVYLDLRHLGERHLQQRLPFICELAKAYVNVDPAKALIPIRPAVHYTMGGILTDAQCQTSIAGLFAVGECASVGLHGSNRLGSNSLSELLVFGHVAGKQAVSFAKTAKAATRTEVVQYCQQQQQQLQAKLGVKNADSVAAIRHEMTLAMEQGCGIYRDTAGMQQCLATLAHLQQRYQQVFVSDHSKVFNTELIQHYELGFGLDVANAMVSSALARQESRGAHQRLDDGMQQRDDERFLQHSLAQLTEQGTASIRYQPVRITQSKPAVRRYGAEPSQQEQR
ncbi:fumarate reductase (quinol) flavoprotein subunit [Alishewanella sp. SMS8]|uniref:fumarate reductase (quinol) flavoprotein subunit n=1 Tax=Alishewanella sp. SMS8 TaxID=2994676 RepID=UPI002740AD81|nr:fumarate reductase (quinol) flavoprotein subunit [Alishewanella sp. SMS8]MDP5458656.1 fumarate reductase (quinol) flavoprotein subunit [Alishewanella sp. SMS8]